MDFKGIVASQRETLEEMEKREGFVERELANVARSHIANPNALVLLGPRRSGKSVLSYMLAKRYNFGYVNFDDDRLAGVKTSDLDDILKAFLELYGDVDCVVLDEVQEAPGWEMFVSRLRTTKRVIATGSNSRLLSGELATHLTGRYIDVTLYPFSYREYSRLGRRIAYTTRDRAAAIRALEGYMSDGGFPEVARNGRGMLTRIFGDVVAKDVVRRHGVVKQAKLRELAIFLVSNSGNETRYARLQESMEIGHKSTVSNWVSYLEQAYILFKLDRFDYKLRNQYLSPKKIYCIDPGMQEAVGFRSTGDVGRKMETVVAGDLMRRKAMEFDLEVYYWKDHQQREVDFVLKCGPEVQQLIQVTYASDRKEIPERELKSLGRASEALRCKDLLVITWDYEGEERLDGKKIKYIPLWKWLLENGMEK
jgi:predicted AAA+ superfamily ATPase